MARLWQSGFEENSAAIEWTSTAGAAGSIQTTTVRSGTYAGKITGLASGVDSYWDYQFAASDSSAGFFPSVHFRIGTLPNVAQDIILAVVDSTGNIAGRLQLDSTGKMGVADNSGSQIGSTTTLSINTWYKLDLQYNNGATTVVFRVNGAVIASSTTATTAVIRDLRIGGNIGGGTDTAGVFYFDDVCINDTTGANQTSYPTDDKIVHMHPTGAGDNTAWSIFAGSSNWNAVSEVTPDGNTSAVQSSTAAQLDDYAMTADASIGSGDTINVVAVGGYFEGTAASANSTFKFRVKGASGGTVTESAAITPTATGYLQNALVVPKNYPLVTYTNPGGGNWTKASLGTSQIGLDLSAASTNKVRVSTVWMSVAFTPGAGGVTYNSELTMLGVG